MKVILPIVVQHEIKSYNHYALPLCVLFTEESFARGFIKNFTNQIGPEDVSKWGSFGLRFADKISSAKRKNKY